MTLLSHWYRIRGRFLAGQDTDLTQKLATVPVEARLVLDTSLDKIKDNVLKHLDIIAQYTGSDIFLLRPREADPDNISASYANGTDQSLEQRLQIAIYGDVESSEHAKMRVLIMIDQIVSRLSELWKTPANVGQLKRQVDLLRLETSLHQVICGRTRKTIRYIESITKTAIYFPPPFPRVYGYIPPGAHRRGEDEVYITGVSQENINQAKKKIHALVINTKCYMKEIMVSPHKIDSILLGRLDKVRKVMEANGSYVLFPQLGSQRGMIRIQGVEILHVERTAREIMALVSSCESRYRLAMLIASRPASSIMRHGGSYSQIHRRPTNAHRRLQTSGSCSLTSVPIQAQISRSKSSASLSTAPMMLSRPPWSSFTRYLS